MVIFLLVTLNRQVQLRDSSKSQRILSSQLMCLPVIRDAHGTVLSILL